VLFLIITSKKIQASFFLIPAFSILSITVSFYRFLIFSAIIPLILIHYTLRFLIFSNN